MAEAEIDALLQKKYADLEADFAALVGPALLQPTQVYAFISGRLLACCLWARSSRSLELLLYRKKFFFPAVFSKNRSITCFLKLFCIHLIVWYCIKTNKAQFIEF